MQYKLNIYIYFEKELINEYQILFNFGLISRCNYTSPHTHILHVQQTPN